MFPASKEINRLVRSSLLCSPAGREDSDACERGQEILKMEKKLRMVILK